MKKGKTLPLGDSKKHQKEIKVGGGFKASNSLTDYYYIIIIIDLI